MGKGIFPLGPIVASLHLRPYLSHVHVSKVDVEVNGMEQTINFKEDPRRVRTLDCGAVAGIGANYRLPVGELTPDLRSAGPAQHHRQRELR